MLPPKLMFYGNRGLIAKIMAEEVAPDCEPLGRHNKLIIANGPLATASISCSGRVSAGAKSPLTGGIKEANSGGIMGYRLASLGIRALIIEDKPENKDDLFILHISEGNAELVNANDYKMIGTHELTQRLHQRYGPKCGISCIGPAGEMLMASSGIANTDMDGNPSRFSARGGLGAVMGSKGLKAIVVEDYKKIKPSIRNEEKYKKALKQYVEEIRGAYQTSVGYTLYGTAGSLPTVSEIGALPTYAFRRGSFEKVDEISGEKLRETILERGGKGRATHACMPGCLIRCSNIYPDRDGRPVVASLEYETLSLCGSNLGISDLDHIAEINYLCNDYGLDTIEIGATIGVYMDLGLAEFGDAEIAKKLVREIGTGTLLGKILGEGAAITARIFKSQRAPVVKGQSIAAHEPRALKGMSITYATSPMGADHTAGVTTRAEMDHQDPNIWLEYVRDLQVKIAAIDTLGLCMFITTAGPKIPALVVEMLNGIYGTDHGPDFIASLGKDVIWTEKEFNAKAGLSAAHDKMPEFMLEEPFPPHNAVSDIPKQHYKKFWEPSYWRP